MAAAHMLDTSKRNLRRNFPTTAYCHCTGKSRVKKS